MLINSALSNPAALNVNGKVTLGTTGQTLLSRGSSTLVPSASTMKVVTAIAAYHTLGPDFRIRTSVYPGTEPGSFVLVGAGDPTLRAGWSSYYWDAPTVIALANAAKARGATKVSYDPWLFTGPTWHPDWNPGERTAGAMAPMSALMLDGGRTNAMAGGSARQSDPAWSAGVAFSQLAGAQFAPTIRVQPGSQPIGSVESAPMSTLVRQMLLESDNVLAEAIARHVAIKLGYGSSWQAVNPAMRAVMTAPGANAAALDASDGSGMAMWSRVWPDFMNQALTIIQSNRSGTNAIVNMLPRNGQSGTLAYRLTSVPAGFIAAKTGWVDYGYGLAGFMWTADGQLMRFSFYTWKSFSGSYVTTTTRNALDAIVAATWRCGTNLSNT